MQMASNEQQSARRRQLVTTWALPAVSAVLGAVMWTVRRMPAAWRVRTRPPSSAVPGGTSAAA